MKWQKTSLSVVCLSLRLSTFDAGAAQVIGAASSHSAAEKRIMPAKGGDCNCSWPNYRGGSDKIEIELGDGISLYINIYSTKMWSGSSTAELLISDFDYSGKFDFGGTHTALEQDHTYIGFILRATPSIPLSCFCSITSYCGLFSGRKADV